MSKKLTVSEQYKKYPSSIPFFAVLFGSIIVLYALTTYIVDFKGLDEIGLILLKAAFNGMFHPDWEDIFNFTRYGVPYLLLETFAIAFLGTVIGAILSFPLAIFSARNITNDVCAYIGLTIISIIRAFPTFIYGIIFVKIVGTGPFAGVLTMSISSLGMLTKLLIEAIEDMDKGVLEALDAAGCTQIQKIRHGIIPQLGPSIISIIIYRLDINVKNASILGVVAAGGIGYELLASISARRWSDTGAMLLGLVILVLSLEWISTKIRKKLATGE